MLAILLACGSKLPTATLDVAGHPVKAEIAATYDTRATGLMHRDAMGRDAGMLFIYKDEDVRRFWMKDTRIPLSIAFVNGSGDIVRIAEMKAFDETSITSLVPARYALEMNTGWFTANGVKRGDHIASIPTDLTAE